VVIQNGLHPLLPLPALVDQRVPEPDPGAEIEDVIRRDPALRQSRGHQQLPQMPRVRPVVLRALLVPTQRARLRRLREMHPGANPPQLLDHEPPARRRLQRHLELPATEPCQELPHARTVRRHDPTTRYLTRLDIDPLGSDLRPMLIQAHHDRHPSILLRVEPDAQSSVQPDPPHTVGHGRPFVFD